MSRLLCKLRVFRWSYGAVVEELWRSYERFGWERSSYGFRSVSFEKITLPYLIGPTGLAVLQSGALPFAAVLGVNVRALPDRIMGERLLMLLLVDPFSTSRPGSTSH